MEESAASNRLKLAVVTDEGEAPVALFGESDEAGERTGADHSRFVHEHRRTGRQEVVAQRWPVAAFPFVEQFDDGVGAQSRVALENACSLRGRGDAEHRSPLRGEVGDSSAQDAGLAGTGRPNDQHKPVVSGDGCRGVGLEHVEVADVDRRRRLRVGGLGVDRTG